MRGKKGQNLLDEFTVKRGLESGIDSEDYTS